MKQLVWQRCFANPLQNRKRTVVTFGWQAKSSKTILHLLRSVSAPLVCSVPRPDLDLPKIHIWWSTIFHHMLQQSSSSLFNQCTGRARRATASGCFPKRYSKKKMIKWTFECRSHAFSFSFSSGSPTKCSSTARQRKVCARFAQGFDSSARQVPVTGKQMILANQRQNRAQASRKLAQARPSRATTCPCAATCPFWLSALLYSELYSSLGSYFSFLFFTFLRQFNLIYLQLKSAPRKRHWLILTYKKNCLSFYLDETRASEMKWIRSGPPSECAKRSILGKDISEKTQVRTKS